MACINIDPATPAVDSGRGLHWDTKTECLYFVDAFKATVHCFKPCNNRFTTAVVGGCNSKEPLSFIIPVEDKEGVFLVGMKNKICCIKWDGEACTTGEPSTVAEVDTNEKTKITSAKVDPKGRLWAGNSGEKKSLKISDLTYEEGCGGLYCLAGCGGPKKVKDCLTYSGGFEWSCDKKSFYFTDATKMVVDKYDYCEEEPKICNPKPILTLKDQNICGIIKGMAQDCSGKLYLANYLGCQVVVFDPKCCKVVNNIKIPAKEVFSVCWGGPQNDILFVSTANGEPNPSYPCAGRVFQVTGLGDKGMPARSATLK